MRTPTYVSWLNMRQRCDNENRPDYRHYGGRGIVYTSAWNSFDTFLAEMGERPKGMSLDRIDNNAGYSMANCRWATKDQQALNKRNCVRHEHGGKNMTLSEWSRETGIGRVTLLKRLQRGVSIDLALSTAGYLKMPVNAAGTALVQIT